MQINRFLLQRSAALQAIRLQPSVLVVASVSMSGFVLSPVAALAAVLGAWRLGVDPGWTSHFFVAEGLLSHYQFWFAAAIGAQASAFILNRWVANQSIAQPSVARWQTEP